MRLQLIAAAVLIKFFLISGQSTCFAQGIATWDFGTIPQDGAISGTPGSTIGWGYTVTNNSPTLWLLAQDFAVHHNFQYDIGNDFLFDHPALPPNTSVYVPFDGTNGLVSLTWAPNAPLGFVNSGTFELFASWYDDDPYQNGNYVQYAGSKTTPYRATVEAAANVPEPNPLTWLLGTGTVGCYLCCRLDRRMSVWQQPLLPRNFTSVENIESNR